MDGRELQARAQHASEREDDHEAPARGPAEAMADGEEYGEGEGGEVEYQDGDGDALAVADGHLCARREASWSCVGGEEAVGDTIFLAAAARMTRDERDGRELLRRADSSGSRACLG